jgi:hypothetical protein
MSNIVPFSVAGEHFAVSVPDAIRLRDELSIGIIAAGRTAVQLEADAIAKALRHQLALCEELRKSSSAEVLRLYEMLVAHVRSSVPEALRVLVSP